LAKASGAAVYYRQGTPNSNGTISWDSAEVTVYNAGTTEYWPKLIKDSNGYPWIAWIDTASWSNGPYNLLVAQASSTNGSSWNSPTTLWGTLSAQGVTPIVPLTNGKLMAIKVQNGVVAYSKLYDGSNWGSQVQATSSTFKDYSCEDAVADGDNVHFVFLKSSSYDVVYVKYTYGTGWGSEETVQLSTIYEYHPSITFVSADNVRVFYLYTSSHIRYRDRISGTWLTAVDISTSETSMVSLNSSYQAFGSNFCVTYESGASSPYSVRFAGFGIMPLSVSESSIAISESVSSQSRRAVSTTENLGTPYDSINLQANRTITVTEGLGSPSDAVTTQFRTVRSVSESLGILSDSATYRMIRAAAVLEVSISTSDSAAYRMIRDVAVSEPQITVQDGIARVLWAYRTVSETPVSVSDYALAIISKIVWPMLITSAAFSRISITASEVSRINITAQEFSRITITCAERN
jgi:hypothetical protein